MLTLAELVRMPAGTKEMYTMYRGEESYFLKKLSTYALRANAKVHHKAASLVWDGEDMIDRIVVVKVMRSGRKLKRQGRKKSA